MKISTFIIMMALIGGIFFIYSEMVREANEQFTEVNINSSDWEERYDYIEEINSTVSPIEEKLKVIQDEDEGFFTKLSSGITAIPYAVIVIPMATFGALEIAGKMMVDFFAVFNLPAKIVSIGLLILLIFGLFKLVEFFQRGSV